MTFYNTMKRNILIALLGGFLAGSLATYLLIHHPVVITFDGDPLLIVHVDN